MDKQLLDKIAEEVKAENIQSFERNFKHITYAEKIAKAREELLNTKPKDITKWGWKAWDDNIGGIYGGKIYAIGAESGSGKSTFTNQVAFNISKQGIRVVKYSLEDRLEDIGKEEIFYTCNRLRFIDGKTGYEWIKFLHNEYSGAEFDFYIDKAVQSLCDKEIIELEKEKQVSIADLVKLMEQEAIKGTKVFIIDHLHYFKLNGDKRTDLEIENIMHDINEICRKHNVAVLLVAHYRKLNKEEPDNDAFKDASAVKQVANVIIHIVRDYENGTTKFKISKFRGPIQRKGDIIFEATFDYSTYSYNQMERIDNKPL